MSQVSFNQQFYSGLKDNFLLYNNIEPYFKRRDLTKDTNMLKGYERNKIDTILLNIWDLFMTLLTFMEN